MVAHDPSIAFCRGYNNARFLFGFTTVLPSDKPRCSKDFTNLRTANDASFDPVDLEQ